MPPKKRAAAKAGKAAASKKAKQQTEVVEPEAPTLKDQIAKLKEADKGKVKKFKPDTYCPLSHAVKVYQDYDAMLNQTNIGQNNNKYYIIQVLTDSNSYWAWNRWGRVGEPGANALKGPFSVPDAAVKDFEKKFKDKTKNDWSKRDSFTPLPGKYTLLEMAGDGSDGEEEEATVVQTNSIKTEAPSKLDKQTQELMKLIFDNDMFKATLQKFDIDTKKMPLGKLSKTQIAKGFEALEELEDAIKKKNKQAINEKTSKFYTVIPHSFGRSVPPPITTMEELQNKYDILAVLGDIEMAQSMQKEREKVSAESTKDTVPNTLDVNYQLLNCKLNPLNKTSKEYKILEKYFLATEGHSYRKQKLKDIWEMDRSGETLRYGANDKISHRKLLWHGTNVAVVAAILKTGLRIMPHSGGRVGRGIYFASENNKSAGYVYPAQGKGIMFLNEVALGKQNKITMDDPSLTKAPAGYDSVLACGRMEPDEKLDTTIELDGKKVIVPQGKPKAMPEYAGSSFSQSEYLVYREDQVRMRYLLLFDM